MIGGGEPSGGPGPGMRGGEARYLALLARIAAAAPLHETLQGLVEYVEGELPDATASVLLLDSDGRTLHGASTSGLPAAFNAAIEGLLIGPTVGSCGTAAFTRVPVIVTDIARDPLWVDYRALAAEFGLRACWSTPILSRRQVPATVLGTFALYFRAPREPAAGDRAVLDRAEYLACIAIEADRASTELHEREVEFRTFVDHASDAFFVRAAEGGIVDVNQQACESLGYTRAELLGARPSLFDPTAHPSMLDQLHDRLRTGETVTFESVHKRKDGREFPVEIRMRRFTSRGRAFNLSSVRDISARRTLEEQLRQAQRMESIGRLAGGVAHDFNNLLTVINGYTEVLLSEVAPGSTLDDLTVIRDAGARAAALTAQLLAFSRRTIIAPRPVNLSAVVARLAKMFERLVGEDITLVTEVEPALSSVMADAGQLEQVLVNLVVNARDAMPRGGTLRITTRHGDSELLGGRLVALSVADDGDGMSEDVRARIFEPFFTTKPQGKGSGLGLATVYGIVKQAGGYLRVESTVGRGSTFSVLLRVCEGEEEPAARAGEVELRGTEVVLLVEDEDGVRRLLQRGLEGHGYTVLSAPDGERALVLERAHGGAIDLLVTDVVMPGIHGGALADTIKARRPAMKVLYISGYTDDEVVRHGVVAARESFLQKPFTPLGLVHKVRTVLDEE